MHIFTDIVNKECIKIQKIWIILVFMHDERIKKGGRSLLITKKTNTRVSST